jgi:hypothetical protein
MKKTSSFAEDLIFNSDLSCSEISYSIEKLAFNKPLKLINTTDNILVFKVNLLSIEDKDQSKNCHFYANYT